MLVTMLGSGTSHGVPVVGCSCRVCTSSDERNNRTRSSIWIQSDSASILIDTSTDFRSQAIREGIDRLDGVVFTHTHADHLHGLDDTRSLTLQEPVPLFATESDLADITSRFDYIFKPTQKGGGKPNITLRTIGETPFRVGDVSLTPVRIFHGEIPILGFRCGVFAYVTDCSFIEDESFRALSGVEILILGALRYRPHPTHFTIEQAIEASKRIGATRTILTHMCHDIDHVELESELPSGVEPGYDGLLVEFQ